MAGVESRVMPAKETTIAGRLQIREITVIGVEHSTPTTNELILFKDIHSSPASNSFFSLSLNPIAILLFPPSTPASNPSHQIKGQQSSSRRPTKRVPCDDPCNAGSRRLRQGLTMEQGSLCTYRLHPGRFPSSHTHTHTHTGSSSLRPAHGRVMACSACVCVCVCLLLPIKGVDGFEFLALKVGQREKGAVSPPFPKIDFLSVSSPSLDNHVPLYSISMPRRRRVRVSPALILCNQAKRHQNTAKETKDVF